MSFVLPHVSSVKPSTPSCNLRRLPITQVPQGVSVHIKSSALPCGGSRVVAKMGPPEMRPHNVVAAAVADVAVVDVAAVAAAAQ